MKCVKVIVATRQWPTIVQASTPTMVTRPNAVMFMFVTSKYHQVVLQGRKGLVGTKLGLDEDLTPAQHACKSELWPLFKKAKAVGKCAFWRAAKLFVDGIQICSPSSV
jgi:hypothetical protein